jgi:hypothetical protein
MNTSPDKLPDSLTLTGHRQWSGLWFGVAAMGASSGIIMVGATLIAAPAAGPNAWSTTPLGARVMIIGGCADET